MKHASFRREFSLAAIAAFVLASLACSTTINIPTLQTGPTQTVTINEPPPSGGAVANVTIKMGAGTMTLSGGASGLAQGTIQYNVADWKPAITRNGDTLTLEQNQQNVSGIPTQNVVNDWNIKLGGTPMNLNLQAGAYKGSVDLGGLRLRQLDVQDGASQATVKFSAPNPEPMDELSYKTGASNITLLNLANANFSQMTFQGGAGNYTLDFGGTLQRDATVSIRAGVSGLTIRVPASTAAQVTVTGGLKNVTAQAPWTGSGDTYKTSGTGKGLAITVEMGLGNLNLQ